MQHNLKKSQINKYIELKKIKKKLWYSSDDNNLFFPLMECCLRLKNHAMNGKNWELHWCKYTIH